jgi:nucleotide sugar dehydrogenase
MHVGIIGMGVVGKAQSRMFKDHHQVTYDPVHNDTYPAADLKECDFAIIAVGTPSREDGSANLDYVFTAFNRLPPKLPVIIRSTVPPGTSHKLMQYRESHVVHVPEFLQERKGGEWKESTDVPFLIIGGPPQARDFFWPLLKKVHPGKIHGCSALEAEFIKYSANLYGALRVTFVNEMFRICRTYGANWEEVRLGWLKDPRMTPQYTAMDGFGPGFSGPCWPKDLAALISASTEHGYKPEFLQAIQDANTRFQQ